MRNIIKKILKENDWDWAINSQPPELQDPRSWVGSTFGYGQSVIDSMYNYELERGDDKDYFEIVDVVEDDLILLKHNLDYGVSGVRTNTSIKLFIKQINNGNWVWL